MLVSVELEGTICAPGTDILLLLPRSAANSIPVSIPQIRAQLLVPLVPDLRCENLATGSLGPRQARSDWYFVCYLRNTGRAVVSLGRSRDFYYGEEPRSSTGKRAKLSASFVLGSRRSEAETVEGLSDEATSDEEGKVSPVRSFETRIRGGAGGRDDCARWLPYVKSAEEDSEEQGQIMQLLRQYNPATRSFFKWSILSPSKRLFTVKEMATPAEESQQSVCRAQTPAVREGPFSEQKSVVAQSVG